MKVTIEGTLQEIVRKSQGKQSAILDFVITKGGNMPQTYRITAFANDEQSQDIEMRVNEQVKAECYLNGRQFTNGERKYYNELKLIEFK